MGAEAFEAELPQEVDYIFENLAQYLSKSN